MSDGRMVQLRWGLADDTARGRRARLREMTGVQEMRFAELSERLPPANAITAILSAGVEAIGRIAPLSEEHVRALSIGDRNRLVLALFRSLYGDRASLVAHCLEPDCNERLDFEVPLDRLLQFEPTDEDVPASACARIEIGGRPIDVTFRAPNGADQEAVAAQADRGLEQAADLLLRRTVVSAVTAEAEPIEIGDSTGLLRTALEDTLARLDPDAEILLRLECPACGRATRADLDPYALLKNAIERNGDLIVDVDRLARSYHWSEAEIMALPTTRRRRYLAMIASTEAPS